MLSGAWGLPMPTPNAAKKGPPVRYGLDTLLPQFQPESGPMLSARHAVLHPAW